MKLNMSSNQGPVQNSEPYFKNHAFDREGISKRKTRKRKDDITAGSAPLRGCTSLRTRFYKCNEELIPPTMRLGIHPQLTSSDKEWLDSEV